MNILREWYERYISDPHVVILGVALVIVFMVILTFGQMLAPVLAAIVIAYLLDGAVEKTHQLGAPRLSAVTLVFILFMSFLVFTLLWLVPRLSYQVTQLIRELPNILTLGQNSLLQLPQKYPLLFTEAQVSDLIDTIRAEITSMSQRVLSLSLPAVFGLISLMVYSILVPVLVFFSSRTSTGYSPGSAAACPSSVSWLTKLPMLSTCRSRIMYVARYGKSLSWVRFPLPPSPSWNCTMHCCWQPWWVFP